MRAPQPTRRITPKKKYMYVRQRSSYEEDTRWFPLFVCIYVKKNSCVCFTFVFVFANLFPDKSFYHIESSHNEHFYRTVKVYTIIKATYFVFILYLQNKNLLKQTLISSNFCYIFISNKNIFISASTNTKKCILTVTKCSDRKVVR